MSHNADNSPPPQRARRRVPRLCVAMSIGSLISALHGAMTAVLHGHAQFVLTLSLLLIPPPTHAASPTQITLRAVSRLEESRAIALADVAHITGPDAPILSQVIIIPDPSTERLNPQGWLIITPEHLRRAIDEHANVNWGRVVISGSTCAVRVVTPRVPPPAATATHVAHAPTPLAPTDPASLRARVIERLASILGVEPTDLRAAFDPRDESLLAMRVHGLITEIEPIGRSGRLAMRITVYDADRILAHHTIDARAEIRQTIAIARSPLRRGQLITQDDIAIESQWLPSNQRPAATTLVVGAAAKNHIQPGQIILDRDIQPPIVVSRGDIVSVHVVSGSLVVESRARALASARDGEIVEFESLDPDPRQRARFKARMNGRGRAVMLAEHTNTDHTP